MIDELVAFLRACLDEEERRHRKVTDGSQDSWEWFQGSESVSRRALREVEAKRRIIGLCVQAEITDNGDPVAVILAEAVLRNLALSHADRPGYRNEWRP